MQYSIDEIYDLFMWDTQRSDEENEAKMQKGIDSAKQIKNIFPFMQPILASPEKKQICLGTMCQSYCDAKRRRTSAIYVFAAGVDTGS